MRCRFVPFPSEALRSDVKTTCWQNTRRGKAICQLQGKQQHLKENSSSVCISVLPRVHSSRPLVDVNYQRRSPRSQPNYHRHARCFICEPLNITDSLSRQCEAPRNGQLIKTILYENKSPNVIMT